MDQTIKNARIRETRNATIERRRNMDCRVFEVKADASRMSRTQKEDVNTLFREAKWFRNAYLADNSLSDKCRKVRVKVKDDFEERDLTLLGSQIRQSIISGVKASAKRMRIWSERWPPKAPRPVS